MASTLCSFKARPLNSFQQQQYHHEQQQQTLFTSLGEFPDQDSEDLSSDDASDVSFGSFVATPLIAPEVVSHMLIFNEMMCPSIKPDELATATVIDPLAWQHSIDTTALGMPPSLDFNLDHGFDLDLFSHLGASQNTTTRDNHRDSPLDTSTGGACEHCKQTFGNDTALKTHIRSNKRLRSANQCADCASTFWFTCALRQHSKQCTGAKPRSQQATRLHTMSAKSANNQCDICDRIFSSEHALREHSVRHTPSDMPFACMVCNKGFVRKKKMEIHIATVHNGQKSFMCSHCPRRFSQKGARNLHIKDVHQKLRQFQCPGCTKQFSRKSNWKRHVKSKHGNISI